MNEERYSVVHHPQLPVTNLHHGWRKQEKQTQTLGEAISSISSLLTQLQPTSKLINMSTSPLTVSLVLETITPGTKENPSWINGGITGLAEVREFTSKAGKKCWKVILTDEDTGQRIAITGTGIQRIQDNMFNFVNTPQFKYSDKAFVQVLDFSNQSHPDLDPVPQKLFVAKKTSSQPTAGFHDGMKGNSLFMAHCLIYAKQTIEAVATVKGQLAQQLDDKDIIKCLGVSFFIEGNRQGLNKDVPPLTIPNIAAKKVTPAMAANLENTDGSETGDEDAPF
jgi:hypothetical protein